MAIIAIRSNAINAGNRSQLKILKWAMRISLGDEQPGDIRTKGAEYEQGNGVRWRIFSDSRWELEDVINLGTLCGRLGTVGANLVDNMEPSEIKQAAKDYVVATRVFPDMDAMPEGADRWKYVRDAQPSVPNWFEARESIPPGLTPVDNS